MPPQQVTRRAEPVERPKERPISLKDLKPRETIPEKEQAPIREKKEIDVSELKKALEESLKKKKPEPPTP
jgi:hypothetical protein